MAANKKIDPSRYILRVDNDVTRTHSWKVQLQRRNQVIHKYFADALYGGKGKALAEAKAYRDALLQEVSNADYAIWRRMLKPPGNTSGIVGVSRCISRKVASNGKVTRHASWQAFWKDADGKRRIKSFSVNLYGDDGARERACKARQEGLKEVKRVLAGRMAEMTDTGSNKKR